MEYRDTEDMLLTLARRHDNRANHVLITLQNLYDFWCYALNSLEVDS